MTQSQLNPEVQRIERDYQRSVTITEARPRLVQLGLLLWALVDVALLLVFVVCVLLYVVSGSFSEERAIATLGENSGVAHKRAEERAPESLFVDDANVLSRGEGSYDLYTVMENTNMDWYATFSYMFSSSAGDTDVQDGVIMPGEVRYLSALNTEAGSRPAGVEVVVSDVVWHRIDRHEIPDIAGFLADRQNFVVDASAYAADVMIEGESIARSTFTLRNATPYSYYAPTFTVLLKRGNAIVGINQVVVAQFLSGEVRDVSVHWFGTLPAAGSVELVPAIDYFDKSVYVDPSGATSIDVRDIDFEE